MTEQTIQATHIGAITLFTADKDLAKAFYEKFLQSETIYEDEDSAVFKIGETLVNLLRSSAVPELIEPAKMAATGLRSVYTLPVENVDATMACLPERGIEALERSSGSSVGHPHG
ncbi:VOC family protein [Pararhizobium sp. IMCC21322]|uniref:VOC family protein n=1 Tax=Pararhizobium sp. IMCC21322 TaxID=3067903 RepID=UPI0027410D4C|nr:VOC family protein [Pararhizobium sp. IMCC21322]